MAGKGGYQAPANPAPVSGPGSLSRRTDGGPGSKQAQRYIAGMPNYGDGQDMMQIQGGAPMAATPSPTPVSAAQMAQNAQHNKRKDNHKFLLHHLLLQQHVLMSQFLLAQMQDQDQEWLHLVLHQDK